MNCVACRSNEGTETGVKENGRANVFSKLDEFSYKVLGRISAANPSFREEKSRNILL